MIFDTFRKCSFGCFFGYLGGVLEVFLCYIGRFLGAKHNSKIHDKKAVSRKLSVSLSEYFLKYVFVVRARGYSFIFCLATLPSKQTRKPSLNRERCTPNIIHHPSTMYLFIYVHVLFFLIGNVAD